MLMAPEGKTRWQVVSTVSLSRTESAIGRFWRPFRPRPASPYSHLLRWLHPPRSARPRRPTSSPAPSAARSSRFAASPLAERSAALGGRDRSSCKVATCISASRATRAAVKTRSTAIQRLSLHRLRPHPTHGIRCGWPQRPPILQRPCRSEGRPHRIVHSMCRRRRRPAREDGRRGTLRTEGRLCRPLMRWSPR